MRARVIVPVVIVMALAYGALSGWRYLIHTAVPAMVEDVGGAVREVGRSSSSYALQTARRVTVEIPSGNTTVRPGGAEVEATLVTRTRRTARVAPLALRARRDAEGGLILSVEAPEEHSHAWAELTLRVPPDAAVRVEAKSGNVEAADLRGTVTAKVDSGNVRVSDLGGRADLATGSGNVVARNARNGIAAETGSGNVDLTDVAGEVRAHTGSGNVDLIFTSSRSASASTGSGNVAVTAREPFRGTLEAKTDSGNVRVSLPLGSDCRVRATTRSGRVTSSLPFGEAARTEGEISGRVGEGLGSVVAETGSGNVDLSVTH